jgi:hypothetical protein
LPPDSVSCVDDQGLSRACPYLLGLYLGDGMLTRAPRDVWRLRMTAISPEDELDRSDRRSVVFIPGEDEVARTISRGDEIDRGSAELVTFIAGGDRTGGLTRALQQLEALEVPVPAARTRTEARATDQARAMAGAPGLQEPRRVPRGPDPLRWMSLREPREEVPVPALLLHE